MPLAVALKFRFGFDDSLDVVGVHLVGGLVGTLLIGFFGTTASTRSAVDGLFYGGGFTQLGKQAVAAFSVMIYSFVVTLILALIIKKTIGFRVSEEDEVDRHRRDRARRVGVRLLDPARRRRFRARRARSPRPRGRRRGPAHAGKES